MVFDYKKECKEFYIHDMQAVLNGYASRTTYGPWG